MKNKTCSRCGELKLNTEFFDRNQCKSSASTRQNCRLEPPEIEAAQSQVDNEQPITHVNMADRANAELRSNNAEMLAMLKRLLENFVNHSDKSIMEVVKSWTECGELIRKVEP